MFHVCFAQRCVNPKVMGSKCTGNICLYIDIDDDFAPNQHSARFYWIILMITELNFQQLRKIIYIYIDLIHHGIYIK